MSKTFNFPPSNDSLPSGGATAANQVLEISDLDAIKASVASIDTKTASGGATAANQVLEIADLDAIKASVASLDSKTTTVNTGAVIISSSALPTGAATEATLSALNTKVTAVNTGAVVVSSSALPTGASTESTLSALNAKVTAVNTGAVVVTTLPSLPTGANAIGSVSVSNFPGTQPISGSVSVSNFPATQPVSIATMPSTPVTGTFWQATQPISGTITANAGTGTMAVSAASLPLPSGAATENTLSALNTKVTVCNTGAVIVSSLAASTGRAKVGQLFNDYTGTNVTTAAYVQLTASTAAIVNKIEIFDSSGQALILAVGAAASEVDQLYIFPGGNGAVELAIPASSRISVKAKTATASVGFLAINLYS
jgi:hypothetical protein